MLSGAAFAATAFAQTNTQALGNTASLRKGRPARRLAVAAVLALEMVGGWVSPSYATVLTWSLDDVRLSDGGVATGSFAFDADTGTFSAIAVTTTAGSAFAGASYNAIAPTPASTATGPYLVTKAQGDLTGTPLLALSLFGGSLSDVGGVIPLDAGTAAEYSCSDASCAYASPLRTVISGEIASISQVGPGVPETSTWVMMLSGLGALGFVRKRRNKAATLPA
jgi:hypothetical protein